MLLFYLISSRLFLLFWPFLLSFLFPGSIVTWNRWDAPHYLFLAENGYTTVGDAANFIVFFPLYPVFVRIAALFLGNYLWSGILTSLIFFLVGFYVFFRLVKLEFSQKTARETTLWLAIFPTAYFFSAPYSESLFFLCLALAFYHSRKRNFFKAGLAAGLATLTRPFGILLAPAMFFDWYQARKKKNLVSLSGLFLPSFLGVGAYLTLNQRLFGNYFAFQETLARHWYKEFAWPWIGFLNSWQTAVSGFHWQAVFIGWAEVISLFLAWFFVPLAFKFLRTSWAIYYLASIALFSSTQYILSTPRYFLSVPFFFVTLALLPKSRGLKVIWGSLSLSLLLYLTFVFTSGRWAF